MLDFVNKSLTAIFGSKSKRDVKALLPVVELVNAEYAKLKGISDNALRGETTKLKAEISKGLEVVDGKIAALHKAIADDTSLDVQKKEDLYDQIDKLEEERNKELEVVLNDILPRAFAVVKETARRWKENGQMEVDATDHDRAIAAKKKNVELKGSSAVWHNRWEAAGVEVVWDMLHYDVQLMGGMVLHSGKIAEMSTGEGKTLVATLPAYLNALAGRGVHIVTVNDYLARRDSEWMAPMFEFHGLTVDCIDYHEPHSEERQQAYLADITYGTNNEFGFDYLRDNMSHSPKDLVQRRHHFAMVDEVDSVLIDDARTPLIISGPVPRGDEHEYQELKPRIHQLVEEQKKLAQNFLNEARKKISEGDEKEGGLALFRAHRGLPTYKPLIKFLSEQGMRAILLKTENYFLQDNQSQMHIADEPLLFVIDEKHNHIDLTDRGIETITRSGEDTSLFVLPDIATELSAIERTAGLSDVEKLEKKEQLLNDYKIKQERIHTLTQLLKAYTLFEKDVDYIIVDSKVKIVDEQTGRVMEGRRYSDGLHQALEAKENVRIEEATQTYATVTLQNYFRMYHKLCGMTGTAETEATEFWEIYKLDVVVIPTNKQAVRKDMEDKVYKTTREKFNAVADEILELTKAGRPVLVGTTSVEISELLSRMLKIRNIKHQVLNAKQHQKEAEIVAEAGKPGTVTIATNMAGRGTDIKLTPESRAAGGLAIVGTERHESRRVDRQLRGRSGRQGDPGTTQFFVSLEDNLMRLFGSDRIAKVMDMMKLPEGEVIQHSMITKSIERAQKKVEENNFGMRKRLLEYDDVMNYQRKAIYKRRRNALFGDRLEVDVLNMIFDTAEDLCGMKGVSSYDDFKLAVIDVFGLNTNIAEEEYQKEKAEALTHKLYLQVINEYTSRYNAITQKLSPIFRDVLTQRGDQVSSVNMPFTDGSKMIHVTADPRKVLEPNSTELRLAVEKYASLGFIDTAWREHLREMDDLRQYVQNAVYEQKDPLMLYKFEGFELFKKLVNRINKETVSFLYDADLPKQATAEVPAQAPRSAKQPAYREAKEEARSVLSGGGAAVQAQGAAVAEPEKVQPIRSQKVANRNDKVSVQYMDGTIKRDVKYKVVEDDVLSNRCVIIED